MFGRYTYVGNDSVNGVDPDGTDPCSFYGCSGQVNILTGEPVNQDISPEQAVNTAIDVATVMVMMADGPEPGPADVGALVGRKAAKKAVRKAFKKGAAKGSSGGPGAGKRFKPETTQQKASKEGEPCQYCGQNTTNEQGRGNSRERDHIIPKSRGGNNTKENEATSCRTCNRQKGEKTGREYEKWKEQSRQ